MSIHYLDNSATTEPSKSAKRALTESLDTFGNPSSVHSPGVAAHNLLESCRAAVSAALGLRRMNGSRLVFTSSGTEANCLAILGYHASKDRLRGGRRPVVIVGDGEHPSVSEPMLRLEGLGYRVVKISTIGGELDFDTLRAVLDEASDEVIFAEFMLVNNETGALYDVRRAASLIHSAYPDAHVHCDAVQAFMKTKFSPISLGVDSLTVSAHKIHAPRGAAALWLSAETVKKKNIAPVLPGGGQEGGLRSGTENLAAIAAFAAACEDEKAHFEENISRVSELRERLDRAMLGMGGSGAVIKRPTNHIPNIVNITLPRIKSETMLNYLSGRGIYVSAGSACSASAGRLSPALAAFGCSDTEIDSSLRVSLSHTNNEEDIDAFVYALADGINFLARF